MYHSRRDWLQSRGYEALIITSEDAHQSEYVADADKKREFVSGFSGSAGTAVISRTNCWLWTDSRYLLQAQQELDPAGGIPEKSAAIGPKGPIPPQLSSNTVSGNRECAEPGRPRGAHYLWRLCAAVVAERVSALILRRRLRGE